MSKQMIIVMTVIVLMGSVLLTFGYGQKETSRKTSINPAVPSGIILSRKPVSIREGWSLCQNLKWIDSWVRIEIEKRIGEILGNISENCCNISASGDIKPDFDNEVTDVYSVPAIERVGKDDYMRLYGAILYEKEGYKGKSQIICKYPQYIAGVFLAEHAKVEKGLKPSSTRPFQIGSFLTKDKGWKVTLYEKTGLNKGFSAEEREIFYNLPDYFSYKEFNLAWSPRSLEIKGDLVAVLMRPNGESETFSNETNGNLSSVLPAATKLIIISGKVIEKLN